MSSRHVKQQRGVFPEKPPNQATFFDARVSFCSLDPHLPQTHPTSKAGKNVVPKGKASIPLFTKMDTRGLSAGGHPAATQKASLCIW